MAQQDLHFFIGTQGDGDGQGILHGTLNSTTGDILLNGLAAEVRRPTWLAVDRENGRLFAVSEVGNKGDCAGEVLSFAIGGTQPPLASLARVSAGGGGTTHLCLSPECDLIYAANFGGGQAARIPVLPDGQLGAAELSAQHTGFGPHPRQNQPHPHGVTLCPDGRFLLVPDMGNDQLVIHALTREGFAKAEPAKCQLPAGAGPRLALFGTQGDRVYLLTELSAEIYVLDWDSQNGVLDIAAQYHLDQPGADGQPSAAALLISGDGRFLYASNRRSGTICVFAIEPASGLLSLIQSIDCGGEKPWGAGLSPDGCWLLVANQASNSIAALRRSVESGMLAIVDGGAIHVQSPTHIAFA